MSVVIDVLPVVRYYKSIKSILEKRFKKKKKENIICKMQQRERARAQEREHLRLSIFFYQRLGVVFL